MTIQHQLSTIRQSMLTDRFWPDNAQDNSPVGVG
jgi:hypothetical protein